LVFFWTVVVWAGALLVPTEPFDDDVVRRAGSEERYGLEVRLALRGAAGAGVAYPRSRAEMLSARAAFAWFARFRSV
jgi:hypothetical protein